MAVEGGGWIEKWCTWVESSPVVAGFVGPEARVLRESGIHALTLLQFRAGVGHSGSERQEGE